MWKRKKRLCVGQMSRVIEVASKRIENGASRLAYSKYPLSANCLAFFDKVAHQFPDTLPFLYLHQSSEFEEPECSHIRRDVAEEIGAIADVLVEANISVALSDWSFEEWGLQMHTTQKEIHGDNLGKLIEVEENWINSRRIAVAAQFWRWYGIPFRYRDGSVYVIKLTNWISVSQYDANSFLYITACNLTENYRRT